MTSRTTAAKLQTVFDKNTYFFKNPIHEKNTQTYIENLIGMIVQLQSEMKESSFSKEVINNFLKKTHALKCILAVSSVSFELLQRIVTIIRKEDFKDFDIYFYKNKWAGGLYEKEWGSKKIQSLVQKNEFFRKAIVNLFFEGEKTILQDFLPEFNLRVLNVDVLDNIPTLSYKTLEILFHYKERGSHAGKKQNNPETLMEKILKNHNIPYEKGDLPLLKTHENVRKRTMDFMIPNKQDPKLIMEFSYLTTTSSGDGDKAKTENGVKDLITEYYPSAKFVGFIDGVGWISRDKDAERLCEAFDDVFTFHEDELVRFDDYLKKILPEYFKND